MTARGIGAVEVARDWIGTPYRHQAAAKGAGTDCLGLVRGIWRELYGTEPEAVPAYTADWSEPEGVERLWQAALRHLVPVAREAELSPGQVLLFRMRDDAVAKHLGIVAETAPVATFIHAYSGHSVVESPLSAPWLRRVAARFEFP
ncbi:MAG TPA: peptidase [Albidovulum sp.]|uniref:peptidase n=1 Tax=Albidovulum sp. TaxID=1872424 RepID=UPI002C7868C9|nr:peptidase [Albidovulum sp.]